MLRQKKNRNRRHIQSRYDILAELYNKWRLIPQLFLLKSQKNPQHSEKLDCVLLWRHGSWKKKFEWNQKRNSMSMGVQSISQPIKEGIFFEQIEMEEDNLEKRAERITILTTFYNRFWRRHFFYCQKKSFRLPNPFPTMKRAFPAFWNNFFTISSINLFSFPLKRFQNFTFYSFSLPPAILYLSPFR